MGSYLTLYTPALDWILQLAAHPGTEQQLMDVLTICKNLNVKRFENSVPYLSVSKHVYFSGLVLNSVMVAFKAVYIAARATLFVDLITACDDDGEPNQIQLKMYDSNFNYFYRVSSIYSVSNAWPVRGCCRSTSRAAFATFEFCVESRQQTFRRQSLCCLCRSLD